MIGFDRYHDYLAVTHAELRNDVISEGFHLTAATTVTSRQGS